MVGRPGQNAPGAVIVNRCLERRLVGEPLAAAAGIGGPGVIGLRAAAALSTIPALVAAPTGPAGPAAAEAAAAAGALGLGDLGRRVAQGRADLVDLDLVDGALLAFLGFVRPLLEPALHDDPHPALQ